MRKIHLTMILVMCLMLVCVAAMADVQIIAGDHITIGHYPQTADGTDSTPIEWIVLEVDDTNHKALVISYYGLDSKPYNLDDIDVTWETCTLRNWMNNDFWNAAFTLEEQGSILTTTVDNSQVQQYGDWTITGGNNTQDKLFLLSYAEAYQYFEVEKGHGNYSSRVEATSYAKAHGVYVSSKDKTLQGSNASWWWLRSPG